MTKKVLYTDFEGIDNVIADLLENKDIKRGITRCNLYKFWGKVVGEKFSTKSKPYGMTYGGVMIVSCANAIVGQELALRKQMIIEKMKPYMRSLRITLKDIKFDPKKWENKED